MEAVRKSDEKNIFLLLQDQSVDVDVADLLGRTPLHHAVEKSNFNVMKLLLEHGGNVDARAFGCFRSRQGQVTALTLAAQGGNLDILKLLLSHSGADAIELNNLKTALCCSAGKGNVDVVRLLLEHGATDHPRFKALVEPFMKKNDRPSKGKTAMSSALHIAAENGHTAVAALLLGHGADPRAKDVQGRTSLCVAASKGRNEIVQLLLESADQLDRKCAATHKVPSHEEKGVVNDMGEYLSCGVMAATRIGHFDMVKMLLDHGADVNYNSLCDGSALYLATTEQHKDIVKLLLENGADVNCRNTPDRVSALHTAACIGNVEIADLLLQYGADIDLTAGQDREGKDSRPNDNWTALKFAAAKRQTKMAQFLLNRGASINST